MNIGGAGKLATRPGPHDSYKKRKVTGKEPSEKKLLTRSRRRFETIHN
jgi:hypothetical protein